MWAEVASTLTTPTSMSVITGAACVAGVVLVIYLSAENTETPVYETRRSMQLLEAARHEADKLQNRDTAKAPAKDGIVCLRSDWETRCWSDRFGISAKALKAAIRRVGPMAGEIDRYLAVNSRRPSTRAPW